MRNSIVEGEPGIFPDPIARVFVAVNRWVRRRVGKEPAGLSSPEAQSQETQSQKTQSQKTQSQKTQSQETRSAPPAPPEEPPAAGPH